MIWRNALKKHPSFGWINVVVHPTTPCAKGPLKRNHPIHVLQHLVSYLNIIPSANIIGITLPHYIKV